MICNSCKIQFVDFITLFPYFTFKCKAGFPQQLPQVPLSVMEGVFHYMTSWKFFNNSLLALIQPRHNIKSKQETDREKQTIWLSFKLLNIGRCASLLFNFK